MDLRSSSPTSTTLAESTPSNDPTGTFGRARQDEAKIQQLLDSLDQTDDLGPKENWCSKGDEIHQDF